MRNFTINQVNQVYYCDTLKDSGVPSAAGEFSLHLTPDNEFYVKQYGAGGLVRSDLIKVENILWKKHTTAAKMATTLRNYTVTLDSTINEGNPVSGQDYILRIEFKNYIGISPEDSTYQKYGMVHAYTGMTASDFYKTLALSLAKNMSREPVKMLAIFLGDTEVTNRTKEADLDGTYTGVTLKQVEPAWELGLIQQKVLEFDVSTVEIEFVEGDFMTSAPWGVVTQSDGAVLTNGKLMADYEYFYHGERGDKNRLVGWPKVTFTKYLVDPEGEYDTYQIHYCYVGSNESVQKSEKDLTLIIPKAKGAAVASAIEAKLNANSQS